MSETERDGGGGITVAAVSTSLSRFKTVNTFSPVTRVTEGWECAVGLPRLRSSSCCLGLSTVGCSMHTERLWRHLTWRLIAIQVHQRNLSFVCKFGCGAHWQKVTVEGGCATAVSWWCTETAVEGARGGLSFSIGRGRQRELQSRAWLRIHNAIVQRSLLLFLSLSLFRPPPLSPLSTPCPFTSTLVHPLSGTRRSAINGFRFRCLNLAFSALCSLFVYSYIPNVTYIYSSSGGKPSRLHTGTIPYRTKFPPFIAGTWRNSHWSLDASSCTHVCSIVKLPM